MAKETVEEGKSQKSLHEQFKNEGYVIYDFADRIGLPRLLANLALDYQAGVFSEMRLRTLKEVVDPEKRGWEVSRDGRNFASLDKFNIAYVKPNEKFRHPNTARIINLYEKKDRLSIILTSEGIKSYEEVARH
jgi:hypothetical protein